MGVSWSSNSCPTTDPNDRLTTVKRLARGLQRFVPPAAALWLAVTVLVATSAAAGAVYLTMGAGSALAFLLGATGALTSSSPLGCAALVGALALAQAPLTQRAAGIGMFAPVIAAIFATVDVATAPLLLGVGTAIGFAFVHTLAMVLKLPQAASPVEPAIAWFHAAVFALFAIPGVFITRSLELGHGFWLVLTLAAVLRPAGRDCRETAWSRLAGTVSGIALAIATGILLPGPLLLLLAAAFAVLMVAWAVCKDVEKQALFGTPVILLLASGGHLTAGVGLGLERLGLTAVAAGLAVAAAAALERLEGRFAPPASDLPT